jgi:hypothetical protein
MVAIDSARSACTQGVAWTIFVLAAGGMCLLFFLVLKYGVIKLWYEDKRPAHKRQSCTDKLCCQNSRKAAIAAKKDRDEILARANEAKMNDFQKTRVIAGRSAAELFEEYDADGSGDIDILEFHLLIQELQENNDLDDDEVDNAVDMADGLAEISFDEFDNDSATAESTCESPRCPASASARPVFSLCMRTLRHSNRHPFSAFLPPSLFQRLTHRDDHQLWRRRR